MIQITSHDKDGRAIGVKYDKNPDTCPICHKGIEPKNYDAFIAFDSRLEIIFRCPRQDCLSFFIATYKFSSPRADRFAILTNTAPYLPEGRKFSEIIETLSPEFCKIYTQAMIAEQLRLDQICGLGYRKSLEFLIKDYAIQTDQTKEDEIKKSYLGDCINTYVDDARIKECAKLATWLGNDETHYVRKWIDKDLQDLKILINLTVNWIENIKLTEKYITEMKKNP